jgi:hypothetical protein
MLRNPTTFTILFISLMVVGFNVAAILTTTFADDKDCRKNDDNNCNETKKTQKSSPKAECDLDTDIKDHNKNSIVGPTDIQCNSNSQSLIDSNIQSSPSGDDNDNGSTSPPPSLTLIPASGPPGTVINVFGSNFEPEDELSITFDGEAVIPVQSDMEGNFSGDFQIFTPILGPHIVTAEEIINEPLASATFTVISGPPIIIIDPTVGPTGTSVNVTGIGFPENSIINILYDGDIVPTTPVVVEPNDIGVFTAFITIPLGVLGNHQIAAIIEDSEDPSADATFRVTQGATMTDQKPSIDASIGPPSTNTATQGILPF